MAAVFDNLATASAALGPPFDSEFWSGASRASRARQRGIIIACHGVAGRTPTLTVTHGGPEQAENVGRTFLSGRLCDDSFSSTILSFTVHHKPVLFFKTSLLYVVNKVAFCTAKTFACCADEGVILEFTNVGRRVCCPTVGTGI